MDFAAGTQVTSVVRLVRPLGRGGMGAVWVAEHLMLKTEVVVKFMADALASDPVSLARFSREAAAAAAVKSPHVVQMLDHGFTADGTPFIVMELLEGEDLKTRLMRERVLPMADLAVVMSQACKALARAHAGGIVHRDVKPENIFLCHTDDGEPFIKLLDFGIAKSGAPTDFHMTQTGVTVGTPFYMSPEQAMGAPPVDATTDLWSLGVVAYEAMTGERPFDGPTLGALTMAICNHGPPVPSAVEPTVTPELDAWIAQACARDREARFKTAKAMSDAFAAALGGAGRARSLPALAFEATSASHGSTPPPERLAPLASRPPSPFPVPVAASSEPATDPSPSFGTTTNPLSRTTNPSPHDAANAVVVAAPVALPRGPVPPAVVARSVNRARWIGVAATLVAAAVTVWLTAPQRDVDKRSGPIEDATGLAAAAPTSPASAGVAGAAGAVEAAPALPPSSSPWMPATAPSATAPIASSAAPSKAPPGASSSRGAGHGAPVPSASASPAPPRGATACDPPFFFDSAHNKVFKPECL